MFSTAVASVGAPLLNTPVLPVFPDKFSATRSITESSGRQPGWVKHDYQSGLHSSARTPPSSTRMDETLVVTAENVAYTVWRDPTTRAEQSCEVFSNSPQYQKQAFLRVGAQYVGKVQVPMGDPAVNVTADKWTGELDSLKHAAGRSF